jgi:Winged helix-turn helix
MRGRKPRPLALAPEDVPHFQRLARADSAPWFQVRRARICLAIAAGQRVRVVASQLQCSTATVRRACRLYRRAGLPGLLARPRRSGRPARLSPPATRSNHPLGLPGAGRLRAAHHALV